MQDSSVVRKPAQRVHVPESCAPFKKVLASRAPEHLQNHILVPVYINARLLFTLNIFLEDGNNAGNSLYLSLVESVGRSNWQKSMEQVKFTPSRLYVTCAVDSKDEIEEVY